jgi:proton-coupled amino acid transporter
MARFLSARVVVAKGFTPTLGETTDGTYVVEIAKKLLKIHKSEGSGYCRMKLFDIKAGDRMRGMTGKYAVHFKICCFSGSSQTRASSMPTSTAILDRRRASGTFATAFVSTFKSVFGSGILAFPFAIACAGLWPGLLGTTIVCAWSFYTAHLIAQCTSLVPTARSYDDVCEASLGACGKWVGAVNLVVHQILVSTAYLTFAAQNVADVCGAQCLSAADGVSYSWRVIAALAPLYVAFCLMRDISVLSPVSAVGNVAVLLCLAVILYDAIPSMQVSNLEPISDEGLRGAASFFGIAAFTFAGQTEVVSVYLSLRDKRAYTPVLLSVGAAAFVVFAGFGVLVYASFGAATRANIFENLDGDAAAAAKLLMSVVMYLSIPLKMMPAFEVFEKGVRGRDWAQFWRLALRAVLALAPAVLATAISDFGFIVEFVGAFSLGLIAFVLPPLMYIRLGGASSMRGEGVGSCSSALHVALFIAGVVVCATTTAGVVVAKLQHV